MYKNRRRFLRMLAHWLESWNVPFHFVVVPLCVAAGFGIAVISGILQGDPMQKGTKPPGGILAAAGVGLEQSGIAAQAFQYISASGDPQKQEEVMRNLKTQYNTMDEKNKAQLKKMVQEKYPDKVEEIKKKAKEEGQP